MISFTMNKGLWLKGCLHCHSTLSDGVLSPEDVAHFYEERGYTLLSITDHNKISKVKEFRGIYHYGIEISKGRCKLGESYHIVILGIDDPAILNMDDVQSIIDYSKEAGGLAFIAHPYWSNLVHEDLDKLEGYVGIEIYNTGCDVEVAKGYSLIHWDGLLTLSRKTWGIAVDDSHRYFKPPIDADGGWIWVYVDDTDQERTLRAIRDGNFYASMSPKIVTLSYASNSLLIESTPISRLNLITSNGMGFSISLDTIIRILDSWRDPNKRRICENTIMSVECVDGEEQQNIYVETVRNEKFVIERNNEGITKFEVKREIKYPYLRVEVIDNEGKYAWTNPIINL